MAYRVVEVAEGCVSQRVDLVAPNALLLVPDLGCGKLVAIVGPRGGIRDVLFATKEGIIPLTKTLLRAFKPETILNKQLYEKVMRKAR